ncbi:MAG: type VI secretion system tip protein VgrG [Myxococcales bacterium]|nr:type VI secretion system tip protein VgrG [Myxococcales bacterium]
MAFVFDQTQGDAELLVLVDHNRGFPRLHEDDEALALADGGLGAAGVESLHAFRWGRRLTPTAVVQRAFAWQRPSEPHGAAKEGADLRGRRREVYEHDDRVYPEDAERLSQIKQERLQAPSRRASAGSDATLVRAGGALAIRGHGRGGDYLVTRVTHRGECPEESILQGGLLAAAGPSAAPRYTNTFECQPLDLPFRPVLTKTKPKVAGVQTATVTGPPGEEVFCDEHGRIKILPHWDRLSPVDEGSSWWVRVAQHSAGPGWGTVFLPRIGMEVVVDFIDGDPDRPIVVGCVYNGDNPPPYALPDDKTKTTIRTSSSPGGGGFNELSFEDQAGAEEVFLHAQRDYNAVVNANRTLSVGANDTTSVGANRTAVIGANDSTAVGANKSVTVGANYSESCGASHSVSVGAAESISVAAAQSVSVGGAQSVSVGAAQSVSVAADQSTTVGGSQSATVTGDQTNTITGNQTNTVTGNQSNEVTGDQSHTITGDHALTVTGTHALTVTGAATETLSAGAAIGVTGAYTLTISGELTVDAGGRASIKASRIELSGGDSKVSVEPGLVTVEGGCLVDIKTSGDVTVNGGAAVSITGGADVTITGSAVKLNC